MSCLGCFSEAVNIIELIDEKLKKIEELAKRIEAAALEGAAASNEIQRSFAFKLSPLPIPDPVVPS